MGIETAIIGAGLVGAGASIWGAKKSSDAVSNAAKSASDTDRYIYDQNRDLFKPFYDVGTAALPGLSAWDAANPLPSYQKEVIDPMNSWRYEQSPAYQAQNTLAQQGLNSQLQARGLTSSGLGAVKSADLSRKLTADDYNTERNYRLGQYTDKYKSLLNDNTTRYQQLLDQVKVGQGAAGSLGQANNQYAQSVGQNTMAAGQAEASFYSGLGGLPFQAASTGLRTADYGNRAGWWGGNGVNQAGLNAANVAYNPSMAPDTGALYGL